MVYGSKAVLPSDIAFGAPRIQMYEKNEAEATRCTDIDSAAEGRALGRCVGAGPGRGETGCAGEGKKEKGWAASWAAWAEVGRSGLVWLG